MSYEVLARKWRPQQFTDIVGQQHISQTLQNAIKHNRVGHAYLFTGPRGIGKTTSARIFAKALNCENPLEGPEPCCECRSCTDIASGSCMDIMEIDGASHNKIEHVRDIRDNVQYAASRCRYKIYIIDEVHMLTNQAWNALLKTLEEPPPHVKFFFATTEPHKVLATIMSRCQRFDLKRVPTQMIADHLKEIAQAETINISERALSTIARAADGGMRDAQSIFDQMIAFCGGLEDDKAIEEEDVINVFGLASGAELQTLAKALVQNNIAAAIEVIQGLADRGRDLERLYSDLIIFMRNVMLSSICAEPSRVLDVSDQEIQDLQAIGDMTDPDTIQRITEALTNSEYLLKNALNKRVYFEVSLVRVLREAHSTQLDTILKRLNTLREQGIPVREGEPIEIPPQPQPAQSPITQSQHDAPPPAPPPDSKEDTIPNSANTATVSQNLDTAKPAAPQANKTTPPETPAPTPSAVGASEPEPTPEQEPQTDQLEVTPPSASTEPTNQPASNNQIPTLPQQPNTGIDKHAPIETPMPTPDVTPRTTPSSLEATSEQPLDTPRPAENNAIATDSVDQDKTGESKPLTPTTQTEQALANEPPPFVPTTLPPETDIQPPSPSRLPEEEEEEEAAEKDNTPPYTTQEPAPPTPTDPPAASKADTQAGATQAAQDLPEPATTADSEMQTIVSTAGNGQPQNTDRSNEESSPALSNTGDTKNPAINIHHQLIERSVEKFDDPLVKNYLKELLPVSCIEHNLQLAYDEEVPDEHIRFLQKSEHHSKLNELLQSITGNTEARLLIKKWIKGLSDNDDTRKLTASPEVWDRVTKNNFIQNICNDFNAEIVDVRG